MTVAFDAVSLEVYAHAIMALETERRVSESELVAEIVMLRALLDEAGVTIPITTGAECLRRIRVLFLAAGFDDPEQHSELTAEWWMHKEAAA